MGERLLENGQVVAARYVLLRKLGAGQDTEVWHARDRSDSRDRALKLLRPARAPGDPVREAFLQAVRLQQRIEHPHVLRCEHVSEDEPVCAAFEFCSRGDLSQLRGRSWQELLPLLSGIAAGAGALHASGVVHRDLKPANVLLGDDGAARISDLGLAAPPGDTSAPASGSPFSASPQQLRGAAPSVADDVYGFGALGYELLSGYPPYYPDEELARTHERPVPQLRAAPALPEALERLVMSCLSVDPAERPADFAAVRAALREIAIDSTPQGATTNAGVARRVQAPEEPISRIEPQWHRAPVSGPSATELRAQGFRRGLVAAALVLLLLGAGFVFFALPRWVAPPITTTPPVAADVEPAKLPPAPEKDLKRLAEFKEQFDELRPAVGDRLQKLTDRNAADWAGDEFSHGRDTLAAADSLYEARDLEPALARLKEASAELLAVEKSAAGKLRAALAAGADALRSGSAEDARRQFELALKIDAASAVAKRGLERASSLDEVRRLLALAATQEQAGNRSGAEQSYRAALTLDPDAAEAREGLARLQSAASAGAFAAAIADGLGALSRRDADAARNAFKRAGSIRPGAPEVQDGLAQADRLLGDESIAQNLATAQSAERQERWSEALAAYRKALAVDPNLLTAQQGVDRTEPRAMLNAELESYIARPERLFTTEVREAARNAIRRAQNLPDQGAQLSRQIATIGQLVDSAEVPVTLAFTSDNVTEVTIFRVGKLGMFERRDMSLLPGRYTVVGTRAGYRDVRHELTILPGQAPAPVVIRCEDPI